MWSDEHGNHYNKKKCIVTFLIPMKIIYEERQVECQLFWLLDDY